MGSTGTQREIVKAEIVTYGGEITEFRLDGPILADWLKQIEEEPERFQVYEMDDTRTVYGMREKFTGSVWVALLITTAPGQQAAPGTCGRALSTGQPCPDHPVPAQPQTIDIPCAVIGAPGYVDFIGTLVYEADTFGKAVVRATLDGTEDLFVVPSGSVVRMDGGTALIEFDPQDWVAAVELAGRDTPYGETSLERVAAVAAYLAGLEYHERHNVLSLATRVATRRSEG